MQRRNKKLKLIMVFDVPVDIHKQLKVLAATVGVNMCTLATIAIQQYIKRAENGDDESPMLTLAEDIANIEKARELSLKFSKEAEQR